MLSESFLCKSLKFLGAIFCRLPSWLNLAIARSVGFLGYYFLPKKRSVIESNLKVAFPGKDSREIRLMTKEVLKNFASSFIDLLCLPKIKKEGYQKTVIVEGLENFKQALDLGRGCILLAVHSGSWELASLVSSMGDYPYSVVANEQQKAPQLNELLNEYRRMAGAKVIPPGTATRDIIRALYNNEIVCLVLDQGGKDGVPVEFFGKTAAMSTGAIRLGIKYQTPICPGWIYRREDGKQVIKFFSPLLLNFSGNEQKDIFEHTQKITRFYENLLREHPLEYMWFYKIYKYTTQAEVLILDDAKTGHLRQSQAVSEDLKFILQKKDKKIQIKTVAVEFKNLWLEKAFALYCFFAQVFIFLRTECVLKFFLKEDSFKKLSSFKPDYIISCGSKVAGVSFILSRLWSIKTIHILKPGILDLHWFSLLIFPEHDKAGVKSSSKVVFTKGALNLITSDYLKEQEERLLLRYSHLKTSVRTKLGVLLGGNAKGVTFDLQQIRFLIKKLKEAAQHYNIDLLVTTSRRTPADIDEMIIKELRRFERCPLLIVANEINIPEVVGGILALSDFLVVSGESISMVSEAVSSGKKTIVFSPVGQYSNNPSTKYDRFVLGLNQQRYLLACSIKDISVALDQALSQKISTKTIDDHHVILKAIEGIL